MHVGYLHFGYLEIHIFFIIRCSFTTQFAGCLNLVSIQFHLFHCLERQKVVKW